MVGTIYDDIKLETTDRTTIPVHITGPSIFRQLFSNNVHEIGPSRIGVASGFTATTTLRKDISLQINKRQIIKR